jgi:flagellar motor switch protein FliM
MEDNKELLTEEEMSALLPEQEDSAERSARKRIVPYNFRRPDRVPKDQMRSLYQLHDLFAHNLSSSLPLFLRVFSEVNLISVEQQSFSEYTKGLNDPSNIFTFAVEKLRGLFAIELNASIAFPIIDRLLGGKGDDLTEKRAATELELKVLDTFLTIIADNYCEAWKPIIEFNTEIVSRETRPQMLQIAPPNEVVITVVYQIQIGESRGMMSFCLPVAMLEPIMENFNQSTYSPHTATPPEATRSLLKTLSTVRFPVAVELEKVPAIVADLMALSVGDVLRTNHRVEKAVEINIGDESKFIGRLGALEGRILTQITDRKEQNASAAATAN